MQKYRGGGVDHLGKRARSLVADGQVPTFIRQGGIQEGSTDEEEESDDWFGSFSENGIMGFEEWGFESEGTYDGVNTLDSFPDSVDMQDIMMNNLRMEESPKVLDMEGSMKDSMELLADEYLG